MAKNNANKLPEDPLHFCKRTGLVVGELAETARVHRQQFYNFSEFGWPEVEKMKLLLALARLEKEIANYKDQWVRACA